ncbi:hypothetical protein, partial [Simiduia curdlanivorans]
MRYFRYKAASGKLLHGASLRIVVATSNLRRIARPVIRGGGAATRHPSVQLVGIHSGCDLTKF